MHEKTSEEQRTDQQKPDLALIEPNNEEEKESRRVADIVYKILAEKAAKTIYTPREKIHCNSHASWLNTEKENNPPEFPIDELVTAMKALQLEQQQKDATGLDFSVSDSNDDDAVDLGPIEVDSANTMNNPFDQSSDGELAEVEFLSINPFNVSDLESLSEKEKNPLEFSMDEIEQQKQQDATGLDFSVSDSNDDDEVDLGPIEVDGAHVLPTSDSAHTMNNPFDQSSDGELAEVELLSINPFNGSDLESLSEKEKNPLEFSIDKLVFSVPDSNGDDEVELGSHVLPTSDSANTINMTFDQDSDGELAALKENQSEASNEVKLSSTNPFNGSDLVSLSDTEFDKDAAKNFIKRVEHRTAIPEWALSPEIFNVDKPRDAVSLDTKLPKMHTMKTGSHLKISVVEIYSPFQFWFHNVGNSDININSITEVMNDFYANISAKNEWLINPYFMQPGLLCAVHYKLIWRRGRVIQKPDSDGGSDCVSVYLVDFGLCVDVDRKATYFLNRWLADQPALAIRGTLTDLYPLSTRWPYVVILELKRLVFEHERDALIKQIDESNDIVFLSVLVKETATTVSKVLIAAGMAGHSRNFTKESLEANCGRRLRYLRERLPTFEMLETRVFPTDQPELEDKLDEIIYSHEFHVNFQPPKLANPFLNGLEVALATWLLEYKSAELEFRQLVQKKRDEHEQKKKI